MVRFDDGEREVLGGKVYILEKVEMKMRLGFWQATREADMRGRETGMMRSGMYRSASIL